MPPLSDEFKRHVHSLIMEAADKVRDENAKHKNELVHKAIQTQHDANQYISSNDIPRRRCRYRVQF